MDRKTVLILMVCLSMPFFIGCQEPAKKIKTDNAAKEIKVPANMIGIWESDAPGEAKWAFKIEPDGSIPKLIHVVAGQINVSEGGYDIEGPDPGTYAAFIIGPCESSFDAASGVFTVHIVLEDFVMKLPQGELRGKSDDYFKGKVSKDGKTWKADWFNYSSLEGGSPPDVNEINANPEKLVFKKLDLSNSANP